MKNPVEELFKSTTAYSETCSHCGSDITDEVSKAMKKRRKSAGTAKEIGNTMEPHRGGKTGSQVDHPRPGYKVPGAVDRKHASKPHAPPSVFGKSDGAPAALFPAVSRASLVQYEADDAGMVEKIEAGDFDPGSQRNLHTEPRGE